MTEIRSLQKDSAVAEPAVRYALAFSPEPVDLARRLLDHPNGAVVEAAMRALAEKPELAAELITPEWIGQAAKDGNPARRRLAAIAIRSHGGEGSPAVNPAVNNVLRDLLNDPDATVVDAACSSAAAIGRPRECSRHRPPSQRCAPARRRHRGVGRLWIENRGHAGGSDER